MNRFATNLKNSILIAVLFFCGMNYPQDDPNVDNTFHLIRQPSVLPNSPLGREIITSDEGFDNFYLGVDFAEPHISANPNNPTEYFNAFNTNATHYTYDGVEWFFQVPAFGTVMRGDPVTAYDSLGNLYYENMYGSGSIEGCKVIVSSDNGATWSTAVTSVFGGDKNWIAADQTSGPYANYVYTTMTAGSGVGHFARSTDLGVTWQNTFSPSTQSLPGMMVAVGPNTIGTDVPGGAVYVVTNSGSAFASVYTFYASTNGGQTFSLKSSQGFANYVGTNVNGRNSVENMRTRPYPFIAADNSYGTYRGRMYLVYASNTPAGNGNKPDIFCRYSNDQGASWSSPVVINDDPNTTANHQWMPAIWCDKQTGRLYAKWFDTRNVPTSDSAEVYASFSDDGGVTWATNQNLSTAKFKIDCSTCGGGGTPRYQGDYDAIISNSITSMAVWSDFRFGNFGSYVAYFPDFAMTISQTVADTIKPNEFSDVTAKVPAVKLYDKSVKFFAESDPPASFVFDFPEGDSLISFPDSLTIRINANNSPSDNYTIRIFGIGPNSTPIHERDFELLVTDPVTTVLQPNGGDILYVGTLYPIRWDKIFVDLVKIDYSTDGGSSWTLIADGVDNKIIDNGFDSPSTFNQYDWVVPNTLSSDCLVRISDSNDPFVFDVSDSPFSIEIGPQPGWTTQISGETSNILCVDIVDTLYAWAGTNDGKALRTTDGGVTWQPCSGSPGGEVTSISALDDSKAIVIVNEAGSTKIRRTVAFGISWSTVYEDNSAGAHLNSITMLDESNGYAVGDPVSGQWVILKTTDGGTNWISASSLSQNGSEKGINNSMKWLDDQIGWFGTDNSSVYRTTNGGTNWFFGTTTFQSNNAVAFTDNFTGVTAGTEINWTTDGGASWFLKSEQIPGEIVSVGSPDQIEGKYFFVSGGDVYKTDNSGDSYVLNYSQIDNLLFIDVEVVRVDENNWIIAYAVGENGTIAKYKELYLVVGAETEVNTIPESFALKQNYPNPFNPTTTIEFSLPIAADVQLTVFNILGQQVASLINEQVSAGNHSILWNANGSNGMKLSSGIYFYMLKASGVDGNEFQKIKKMILLK
ncbi:MAG: T9SS type A sorting domain-containing protein [Ignavibacteriaceae bacterium]|nr:T9SS type A sorting domain-containing protein [Ignavibacteriaceae bacterium]